MAKTKTPKPASVISASAKALKRYIASQNMTQEAFAAKLDVSKAYISMLVNGKVTPSLAVAVAIEKIVPGATPQGWSKTAR